MNRTEVLFTICDTLTTHDVNWWLTDGTLLGYIRDGGFIPHDSDMDLGVEAATVNPGTFAALEANGMQLGRTYGIAGCDFMSYGVDGIFVDLFKFYPHPHRGMYHSCYVGFTKTDAERVDYVYPDFAGETQPAEWWGHPVRIPTNPTRYLATKYGDDWRTPKLGADWEHIGDPVNVHYPRERHPWHKGKPAPPKAPAAT